MPSSESSSECSALKTPSTNTIFSRSKSLNTGASSVVNSAASGASACVSVSGRVYFQYSSRREGKPMLRTRASASSRAALLQPAASGRTAASSRLAAASCFDFKIAFITQPPRPECLHSHCFQPQAQALVRPFSRYDHPP